jgi:hypothetical protein
MSISWRASAPAGLFYRDFVTGGTLWRSLCVRYKAR